MFCRIKQGKICGQCDQRGGNLWYCSAQLCDLYCVNVFSGGEAGDSAYHRAGDGETLYHAGDSTFFLSDGIYYETDAFFHVGRAGAGLYAHGAGKRPCRGRDSV